MTRARRAAGYAISTSSIVQIPREVTIEKKLIPEKEVPKKQQEAIQTVQQLTRILHREDYRVPITIP